MAGDVVVVEVRGDDGGDTGGDGDGMEGVGDVGEVQTVLPPRTCEAVSVEAVVGNIRGQTCTAQVV